MRKKLLLQNGAHVELRQYLLENGLTIKQAAEMLDVHRNHLSQIVNKKLYPGKLLAKEIVRFTKGKVTTPELLPESEPIICPTCGRKLPKKVKTQKT